MIAAMHFAVTVCAIHTNSKTCTPSISLVKFQHIAYVCATAAKTFCGVALLAKLRTGFVQQGLMIRTMNVVT